MSSIAIGNQPYFYGRITRDEAETILRDRGCQDGLFLLRESTKRMGDYVLSLCCGHNIHHYSMETQPDGKVMIENGKKFVGPGELIEYHKTRRDGLLTFPKIPCNRAPGESYIVFRGVSSVDLEEILLAKAKELKMKGTRAELLNGENRSTLINTVRGNLHTSQPWFHGDISREESERRILQSGVDDGKYLLRHQKDRDEYRLTLGYHGEAKHYIVSCKSSQYFIESGPTFESLIEMVDHYHNKADGLLCPLKTPCKRPSSGTAHVGVAVDFPPPRPDKPPAFGSHIPDLDTDWDEPDTTAVHHPPRNANVRMEVNDETQKIYDSVPTTEASFNLPLSDLELQDKLGAGCFGSVLKGVYRRGGHEMPVAVKTLKLDDAAGKEEILKEARIMAQLKHRNVVRLIGVCHAETVMLVLELAPLGPLNKHLKVEPNWPMQKIINCMFQVALGMKYLESQKFVHRDLAARNVLLVNESYAKISDFGMSKALGMNGEYYKASAAGKWPLKWYAPECIYYFKFDSKSDVWSYGVTMWEATSRGGKPYQRLKGAEIIAMIDQGKRLERPAECTTDLYRIMNQCWAYDKEDRPSFAQLSEIMKKFVR